MRPTLMLPLLLLCVACEEQTRPGPPPTSVVSNKAPASLAGLTVAAPVTHENLAVYLIHRKGAEPQAEYITLEEGLKAGTVKVTEKEQREVNELLIQNDSDKPLYVQSGDLVRGGQQDRAIAQDFVVPPNSKPMPISSFCVEQGRWETRAGEDARGFDRSGGAGQLVSKEMKLAARLDKDQEKVWKEVAESNEATRGSVEFEFQDVAEGPVSTSLWLLQSDETVQKSVNEYAGKLKDLLEGKSDVVGFAFCINGEINTIEIYHDPGLFAKLWPKLLKSAGAEALSKKSEKKTGATPTPEAVLAFINQERASAKKSEEKSGDRMSVTVYDKMDAAIFESKDLEGNVVRCQVIKK